MPPKISISPKNNPLKALVADLISLKLDSSILEANKSLSEYKQSCDHPELKSSDTSPTFFKDTFDATSHPPSTALYSFALKLYDLYKAIVEFDRESPQREPSTKSDDINKYLCNLICQTKEVKVTFIEKISECKKSILDNNKSIEENDINIKIISQLKNPDPDPDLYIFYETKLKNMITYKNELSKDMGYLAYLSSMILFTESYLVNLSHGVISQIDASGCREIRSPKTPTCRSNEMEAENLSISSTNLQSPKILTLVQSDPSGEQDIDSLGQSNPSFLELFFNCSFC